MESSNTYPDSPLDQDEAAFPCKGCGEVKHTPTPYASLLLVMPLSIGLESVANPASSCRYLRKGKRLNWVRFDASDGIRYS